MKMKTPVALAPVSSLASLASLASPASVLLPALAALIGGCGDAPTPAGAGDPAVGSVGQALLTDPAPRPMQPSSGSKVSSHWPVFHADLGPNWTGFRVDICSDRACSNVLTTLRADNSWYTTTPAIELPQGTLFWRTYGRLNGVDGTTPSATWQFRVGAENSGVKANWGAEPDFNGDGLADIAVSSYAADGGKGRAYVFYSNFAPTTVLKPTQPDEWVFSWNGVASAGDVNGDGFADLVVGAIGSTTSTPGRFHVYYGGPNGIPTQPSATFLAPDAGDPFFGNAKGVGDVNGDGYADVLATDWAYGNSVGRAYLYPGSATGLRTNPIVLDSPDPNGVDEFGEWFGPVGDFNADGYADFVISAPLKENGPAYTGAWIYFGHAAGPGWATLLTRYPLRTDSNRPLAGEIADPGDVDGDGFTDVVVRGWNGAGQELMVAYGTNDYHAPDLLQAHETFIDGNAPRLGDVNGDGRDDFVVGTPSEAPVQVGSISVYSGGPRGSAPSLLSVTMDPDGGQTDFGRFLGVLGDVNADGRFDVYAGAPSAAGGLGKAYVFLGKQTGLSSFPAASATGPDGPNSQFGQCGASFSE
jgi:hypothetical protein